MKLLSKIIFVATLFFTPFVVSAATIWTPTNEDTDFIQLEIMSITTNGGTLALFDDADFGGNALIIGQNGGQVVFTDNNNGSWSAQFFDASNTLSGSIILSNNPNFILGMTWGLGYVPDDMNPLLISTPDTYLISFNGVNGFQQGISGQTLAVDLSPVDDDWAPVPVPAAAWLFGSALLVVAGLAKRERS